VSESDPALRRLTLGVMGHVDHGKTALVGALTGMDTDRLPEEKRRGVSIVLGFAHATLGGVEVDFIDMPGHERFVRTLVAGAAGVDAALLVVAANEGVKPQTREHLDIAALLGLRRVLPVIAKADLAAPDTLAEATAAVRAACHEAGVEVLDPVAVSARDGRGLDDLRAAIADLAVGAPPRHDAGFPWLPIDRAFTAPGHGTAVTGTLRRGSLADGAPLRLQPDGRPVRMRGLQVHGRAVAAAAPGQRVAVNLRDLDPAAAPRGAALAPPGALTPARRLTVALSLLATAPTLKSGARLMLLVGAAEAQARLRLLKGDVLAPGASAFAQLETDRPLAVPAGERFVLRAPSPPATVAGGEVIDPAAPRLRRRDPAIVTSLAALAAAPLDARPKVLLDAAGAKAVPIGRLALIAGRTADAVAARLAGLEATAIGPDLAVADTALAAVCEGVTRCLRDRLDACPNGMTRRALAEACADAASAVLDAAVRRLAADGRVRIEGALVRLAPPRPQAEAEAERALASARALAERLRDAALAPPDPADLAPSPTARRTLEALVKAGVAVKTLDRVQKRELVFHRDAVARACAELTPHLAPPGLTVGEAGARLGMTRKFSVPLLEYLDAVRFTRRLGDRRVLGPAGPPC
jgi:selenocysteine-specific elongation factor